MALRVGVIGLGRRGGEWVQAIRGTPGFELAAGVEVDDAVREAAPTRLGLPRPQCHATLAAARAAAPLDALVVATSIDAHVEPSREAIRHGLPLLVEKPFALSVREGAELVERAAAAGVPLLVGQNYRYMRMPRALRRLVAGGTLGPVALVTCAMYRAAPERSRALAGLPDAALWELGVHHLDLLRHVLAQRATGVLAQRSTPAWEPGPPGRSYQALLEFDGGTRATYSVTYGSRGHERFERGQEFYLRMVAERGTLHVFHRWIVWCPRGGWPRPVRRGPRPHSEEAALLHELARAVGGEAPACSGRDNLETLALLEACARSAAEGRRVDPRTLWPGPG
jgi:predicted dehydrogenase